MSWIFIVILINLVLLGGGYYFIFKEDSGNEIEDPYKNKEPVVVLEYDNTGDDYSVEADFDFSVSIEDIINYKQGLKPVENDYLDVFKLKPMYKLLKSVSYEND